MLVPADRLHALLPQRSIRENIALPLFNRIARWGPIRPPRNARVNEAVSRLSIDTRAASQVRRLSGGNQQKVTIARWLAGGLRVMLLFDPTRGIDVGTKHQVYDLVRALADEGAAVLMFTSELREIGLVCDRAAVLHGGRIVAELPAGRRERPAHGGPRPRGGSGMSVSRSTASSTLPEPSSQFSRLARRHGWTVGVRAARRPRGLALLADPRRQRLRHPHDHRRLDVAGVPGDGPERDRHLRGIDLSVGAKMVFANCLSAMWMEDKGLAACLALGLAVVLSPTALSTLTGLIITVSGVPDIIVTLAASFMLSGLACSSSAARAAARPPTSSASSPAACRTSGRRCCGCSAPSC